MPRPKNKTELIELSGANFAQLMTLVGSYNPEELIKEFPTGTLNRNIKDVLAHLHEWHLMLLSWYKIGMQGKKPAMPAEGYTWKTLPDLNQKIWEKYKDVPLQKIRLELNNSFNDMRELIIKYSEEELFEKKRYGWTGTTSLAAYLISATSSHYDWAIKFIKKQKRTDKK